MRSLAISGNTIFAGTYGGGAFRAKLSDLLTDISEENRNLFSSGIEIFPNPADDFIEITKPSEGSANVIRIFNVLGETVSTSVCSADTSASEGQRIDVSGLPSVVYFVRVWDRIGKFVKI